MKIKVKHLVGLTVCLVVLTAILVGRWVSSIPGNADRVWGLMFAISLVLVGACIYGDWIVVRRE